MARLVVVTHEFDRFAWVDKRRGGVAASPYLLLGVLRQLESLGHDWVVTLGARAEPGDIALLHVDSSIVADEYLALRSRYAATINFAAVDISKRNVSRQLLAPGDAWDGPVIVKANLNSGGQMEDFHNRRARRLGKPEPHPGVRRWSEYRVLDGLGAVEDAVWSDPALVVERFLPEREGDDGFAYRTWVFMGKRDRCVRTVTASPVSKGAGALGYSHVEPPEALRGERERLGLEFGSIDFVIHEGEPVLLDANRTPGIAMTLEGMIRAGHRNLAEGLDGLIRERCAAQSNMASARL